jgi:hypothetical protein
MILHIKIFKALTTSIILALLISLSGCKNSEKEREEEIEDIASIDTEALKEKIKQEDTKTELKVKETQEEQAESNKKTTAIQKKEVITQIIEREKETVQTISQGTFTGADDSHWAKGNISVIKREDKYFFSFGSNFSYSSIPDPVIYFGDGTKHDSSTSTGKINIKNGPAEIPVPENIDPTKYSKIFLRCRAFNVAVGSAKLTLK